jgi:hypothetical protein
MNARTPKCTHRAGTMKWMCGEASNVSVNSPFKLVYWRFCYGEGRSTIFHMLAKRVPCPGHATNTMNDRRTDADSTTDNAPVLGAYHSRVAV